MKKTVLSMKPAARYTKNKKKLHRRYSGKKLSIVRLSPALLGHCTLLQTWRYNFSVPVQPLCKLWRALWSEIWYADTCETNCRIYGDTFVQSYRICFKNLNNIKQVYYSQQWYRGPFIWVIWIRNVFSGSSLLSII